MKLLNIFKYINPYKPAGHLIFPKRDFSSAKKKPFNLEDKTILITGGAGRIAGAIAKELLCEKAKRVFLVDKCRNKMIVEELNSKFGDDKAIMLQSDATNTEEMENCFKQVIKKSGNLHVLINAAGVINATCWEDEIHTNLYAPIKNSILAQKYMSGSGIILNFSGIPAIEPLPPSPTLSAEFSGVVAMSQSFGHPRNCRRTNKRVVTLCMGLTNTNFTKNAEKKQLTDHMGSEMKKYLKDTFKQKEEACAKGAAYVLQYAESGSVWLMEGDILYSLDFPPWQKFCRLESSYY